MTTKVPLSVRILQGVLGSLTASNAKRDASLAEAERQMRAEQPEKYAGRPARYYAEKEGDSHE